MNTDTAGDVVYRSGNVSLRELKTERGDRVILDMGCDAVLIVPRMNDGRLILVTQRRPGKEEETYEFPSGGVKKGEQPTEAAARELREETGATGVLTHLMTVEPLSGLVAFTVHIFVADIENVSVENIALEKGEDVTAVTMTQSELRHALSMHRIVDGYIVLGLGALSMHQSGNLQ